MRNRRDAACRAAIGLLLCFQLVACSSAITNEQISVQALASQIEQGSAPLILDVRSPQEYAQGHIPGAVNIEYRDIPNQLETIRAFVRTFENEDVIVYCQRGVRAGVAERALTDAGFDSVIQLTGDMIAWRKADLPISNLPPSTEE